MNLRRISDYLIYSGIGLAFGLGILWAATHIHRDIPKTAVKWIGLAVTTLILFGYAVADYRRYYGRLSFWATVLALLAVHVGLFILVLKHIESWGLLWFAAIIP
jgi:hypothetical protein